MAPLPGVAQPKWEAGPAFGGAGYQGELVPEWYPEWDEAGLIYGLLLRRRLSREWALRLNLTYTELTGDDRNFADDAFKVRNFRFRNRLALGALLLEWEPFGKRRYPDTVYFNGLLSPYFFTGAGLAYFEAAADFSQTGSDGLDARIHMDRSAPFPQKRLAIPLGVGVKLDLGPGVAFSLEASATTAFSDYLDGISHAGMPGTNDWYSSAGAILSFRFIAKDSDRDGIADKEDACPQARGRLSAQGCPDEDGDGVEDLEDVCPADAGPRLLNGCPDTDGDGVADREDLCPLSPGALPTLGCPDLDGDAIADREDECPKLPGPKGRRGCPVLDSDADGSLSDEPEACLFPADAALLADIELLTAPAFGLLRLYRPAFSPKPAEEAAENKAKVEIPGFFDY